ncbi:MAG: Zinc-dependent sulfurtransferase SufU [Verrucomicrobiae bacterium]|nr:Zinc-dependent sulfurtransferase SufU [Verrucomicrobiae bacterium]
MLPSRRMLEELYQEIILDHYRRPRNRGKAVPADLAYKDSNPLCGDEIEVTATLVDGKIKDIKFDGHGCSICLASSSIMTGKLVGKTLAEALNYIENFQKMMRGDIPFGGKEMGDLKALEGVLKFPVRVKCATLAWHTAHRGITAKL